MLRFTSLIVLGLVSLTSCKNDSNTKDSEEIIVSPPPECDETSSCTPENLVEGEKPNKPTEGELEGGNKPGVVGVVTGNQVGNDKPEEKIPVGLVIWKASDHCTARPSGAHDNCLPIPRDSTRIDFPLDAISNTESSLIKNDLQYISNIEYNYYCAGKQEDTFLKIGDQKNAILHGTGSISFGKEFADNGKVELLRGANSFASVSKNCAIVVTKRFTILTSGSVKILKSRFAELPETERASIKSWLASEEKRLNDLGLKPFLLGRKP